MAGEPLETAQACPLCRGERITALPVRNLNSRDDEVTEKLAAAVGGSWFVEQELGVCDGCGHVFQRIRPSEEGLQLLYDHFQEALGKTTPTAERMLRYVFTENRKDYVNAPAASFATLRELGLATSRSVLELRTYGGALAALLKEEGADHVEVGVIQQFDGDVARRLYGVDRIVPYSYVRDIRTIETARETYDLIVMYEGLTHARNPIAVLEWVRDHLSAGGAAVLFREPDTPEYRRYLPLEIVFNNFHLQLFERRTFLAAVSRAGGLEARVLPDRHPGFEQPVYVTAVLRRGATPPPDAVDPAERLAFYRDWIARDGSRRRRLQARIGAAAARRIKLVTGR